MKVETLKSAGLYVLGFCVLGHQAFIADEVSETLLLVALALVGLPSTLIADRILTKPPKVDPPSLPAEEQPDA